MGFKTLAVQKRSSEVWKTLEAVKTEFGKFADQLEKVDKQLNTASKSLDELRNTRTNQINRKLRNVASLDEGESKQVLDLGLGE
jgi:DNA recombination protein RmuC